MKASVTQISRNINNTFSTFSPNQSSTIIELELFGNDSLDLDITNDAELKFKLALILLKDADFDIDVLREVYPEYFI